MLAAMDIATGAILTSLLVCIVIGNCTSRRIRKRVEYFVTSRRVPKLVQKLKYQHQKKA